MKHEAKAAWHKANNIQNERILACIERRKTIPFRDVLAGISDGDGLTIFSDGHEQLLRKSDYVIFQYGLIVRDQTGRLAVFHRQGQDGSHDRNTHGRSIIVSKSDIREPSIAIPSIMASKLSFSRRLATPTPEYICTCWNALLARGQKPQPTYFMPVYQVTIAESYLNGLVRSYPDRFIEWQHPHELDRELLGGFIDKAVVDIMSGRKSERYFEENYGSLRVSQDSPIIGDHPDFVHLDVEPQIPVFISHASQDSFSAFGLFHLLSTQFSSEIYPLIDLYDIGAGENLSQWMKDMIRRSDCAVFVITPSAHSSPGMLKEANFAKELGKRRLGFWLTGDSLPDYLSDVWVPKRSNYPHWLDELDLLRMDILRHR
jgi:hypothetical protein